MHREPIAIVGIGCRLPGARDARSLWELLAGGVDAITEVPPERWDLAAFYDPARVDDGKMSTRWGGFVRDVDRFDPQFFKIAPREVPSMDPQQRVLLETVWEALEDAGQPPEQLAGTATGVFVGMSSFDYSTLLGENKANIDAHFGSGNTNCIAANRVSYLFDLRGPSMVIDTACSSSLVAVHLACRSLWTGDATLAIAGGVQLVLSPWGTVAYSKSGFMSPDGRCKAFDASANGYVRSDGAGIVVLRPLAQALAAHDRIYAVIRGSAVNQDGRSNGLTAPNPAAQEAVLRAAYRDAGVSPASVQYVEAHGSGTRLGDPIEMKSLAAVVGAGRAAGDACAVGSIKSNIGHPEAAAGIAGLLKAALALRHRQIPPSLHFATPNPYIPFDKIALRVPTRLLPWPAEAAPARAGVSSFGFGGTNVHMVLESAPPGAPRELAGVTLRRPRHLLVLRAKTERSLVDLAASYRDFVTGAAELELADLCYSANTGRSNFSHRLAVQATTPAELRGELAAFVAERSDGAGEQGGDADAGASRTAVYAEVIAQKPPRVAFLFTGLGAQYVGMARQLFETQPTFRATLERCDRVLRGYLDRSLLSLLYPDTAAGHAAQNGHDGDHSRESHNGHNGHPGHNGQHGNGLREAVSPDAAALRVTGAPLLRSRRSFFRPSPPSALDDARYAQPALFAIEVALAELWRSWGVVPDIVLGHSLGELAAACVAGVFSLDDGLRFVAERARLLQKLPRAGAMAAVLAPARQVAERLARYGDGAVIASVNGPENVTISGDADTLRAAVAELDAAGVLVQPVRVSQAFHSPLIEPILDELEQLARTIPCGAPRIPLASNVTGRPFASGAVPDAAYWRRHARAPVQFETAIHALHDHGCELMLEIGPTPVLTYLGAQCVPPESTARWLPSLAEHQDDWSVMLTTLSALALRGVAIDWDGFDRDYPRERISLPHYAYQRKRYWFEHAAAQSIASSAVARSASGTTTSGSEVVIPPTNGTAPCKTPVVSAPSSLSATRPIAAPCTMTSALPFEVIDQTAPARPEPPRAIVRELHALAATALRADPATISPDMTFVDMGADSLSLLELVQGIEDRYHQVIGIRELFEQLPTIEALAAHLDRGMEPAPDAAPAAPERQRAIVRELHALTATALRTDPSTISPDMTFVDMGADSLSLLELVQGIEDRYHEVIGIRELFEQLPTIDALAAHLAQCAAPEPAALAPVVIAPAAIAPAVTPPAVTPSLVTPPAVTPPLVTPPAVTPPLVAPPLVTPPVRPASPPADRGRRDAITSSLQRMTGELLRAAPDDLSPHTPFIDLGADSAMLIQLLGRIEARYGQRIKIREVFEELSCIAALAAHLDRRLSSPAAPAETAIAPATPAASSSSSSAPAPAAAIAPAPRAEAPAAPAQRAPAARGTASERQDQHLQSLIARYTRRTARSRELAQQYRAELADSRGVAGFRHAIKEITYPIAGARYRAGRIWDVDGNEYVDIAMGFGVHLFGHSPAFVHQAILAQLETGFGIGPQPALAGELARLFVKLTGSERVVFCQSGSEAVMTALRLARTATRREKIALFRGSFHGHFDGVLAQSAGLDAPTAPVTLGVSAGAVRDVVVLDYGAPSALEYVRAHAGELAAVLVEPVQSRRPDLQPRAFLHELRAITSAAGTALIFDEIITGFRLHLGGAQAFFGVRADLATYGKVPGGGLPLAAVAGSRRFMDGIDGGQWQFGDASGPEADRTFFAGTFNKPPLSLATALAVLGHLEQAGPALQDQLNARTGQLVDELNRSFEAEGAPASVVHCGSLFRFVLRGNLELFYHHLIEHGVYVWEGRSCFLSTAHTEAELAHVVSAVQRSIAELRDGGFYAEAGLVRSGAARSGAPPVLASCAAQPLAPPVLASGAAPPPAAPAPSSRAVEPAAAPSSSASEPPALPPPPVAVARPLSPPPAVDTRDPAPPPEAARREHASATTEARTPVAFWDRRRAPSGNAPASGSTPAPARWQRARDQLAFSLYYFGKYDAAFRDDKYDLLLEGARFADRHGFTALWVPERHFHPFGGFSPNPAIVCAALARETTRLALRAGSVVVPLHHPVRIAEEWSVVDNLSKGRVGISFASGWHPDDFVFAPDAYGVHRERMFEGIETIRALWRGDKVRVRAGGGREIEVGCFPLPMSRELPAWITVVNNPDTYVQAGRIGAGVLTNLLGQSVDDLARNIALYREALAQAGRDPASGQVTVLVHSFVGDDAEAARRTAREPFCDYLDAHVALSRSLIQSQKPSIDVDRLSGDDRRYMLGLAYERYVKDSALIGSAASCEPVLDGLRAVGVDEIACFVDFGIAADAVLGGLPALAQMIDRYRTPAHAVSLAPGAALAPEPPSPLQPPAPATTPLTLAQREALTLVELAGTDTAIGASVCFELQGPLDVACLQRALVTVMNRHDILRARLTARRDALHILAPGDSDVPLVVTDLAAAALSPHDWMVQQLRRGFDLVNEPVFRAVIGKLGPAHHLLRLSSHHALCDGWSIGVLSGELGEIYSAELEHRAPRLPEVMQFGAFVAWQEAQRSTAAMARHEQYWLSQFSGDVPQLELPTDRPRPPIKTYRAGRVQHPIDAELCRGVQRVARQHGSTPVMLLLAAYLYLLHRLSSQDAVIVGTPVAGQLVQMDRALIGHCTSLLALRSSLASCERFTDLLSRTKAVLLEAFEHRDYTFHELVARLQLPHDASRIPLVSVGFNFDRLSPVTMAGLALRYWEDQPIEYALSDTSLNITDLGDEMRAEWNYNLDLFDRETVERWRDSFLSLLGEIVADPARPLSALSIVPGAEQRRMLAALDAGQAQVPDQGLTLHALFDRQAAATPDAPAVTCGAERVSFGELARRSNQLAQHLRTLGATTESRVVLALPRSIDLVVAVLAIWKAGGAYLPVDPRQPAERLARLVSGAQPALVVTTSELAAGLPALGALPVVRLDELAAELAALPDAAPAIDAAPHHAAYVIHTSGSTGEPRGVVVEHRAVVNLLAALRSAIYARHPGALRVAVNGPITFDTSVKQLIQLLDGHCLDIVPEELRRDGEALCGYLRARAVDVLDCTPTQLHLLIAGGLLREPAPVRCVLVGGEAIDGALWQQLAGSAIDFVNVYGPTECTVDATACRIEPGAPRPSLGRPLANVRTYVLDRDRQLVPVGVPGELYIGGAGVARGYLGDPDATAERFLADPFDPRPGATPGPRMYRTGDRVRCHGDGSLEFLGRLDHQVKLRGFRVDLGEIEAVVARQPGVQACAVDLVGAGERDRKLVAYVAPAEACTAALSRALRTSLPEHMVPAALVGLPALPVTPNGKLDRAALPPPSASAITAPGDEHVAPRTPSETLLTEIWAELLYGDAARAPSISVTANFFHLGGSSLLAVRMLQLIERRLGQNLRIQELLEEPTVEHLAEVVRRLNTWEGVVQRYDGAIGTPSDREYQVRRNILVTVRDRGAHPPMFYVGGLTGIYPSTLMAGVLNLVEHLDPELPFYGLQTPALAPELANAGRQAVAGWRYDRSGFERLAGESIARIEEVHPSGPISLVAFCSGNRLTLEIARRLRARGRTIHAHVMLDPTIDLPEEKPAQQSSVLASLERPLVEIAWFVTHTIGWRAGWDPVALYHALHGLPPEQRWQHARDKLVEAGQVPAHVTDEALRHVFEMRMTERAILRRLTDELPPGRYDGPVTLLFTEQLRARASEQRIEEALRHLRSYLTGALEVRTTRGDHITAFHEPHVRALAAELNRVLAG